MAKKALTARSVEAEKAPETGRKQIYDTTMPGLVLRVTEKGAKSFQVVYRFGGYQRRMTIGRYPAWTLAKARDAARDALQKVDEGIDPAAERQEAKKRREPEPDTVERVAGSYVERYAKRNLRSWTETKRLFDLYLIPRLGDMQMRNVTRRDVRELVDGVVDAGKPVQANRVLAAVHALCEWAVEREIIDANPAAGVRKPTKEKPRERVLSDAELRAVWQACGELGYPAGPFVRMLILTGQRRDEVRCMRWSEVDMGRGVWTIPGARSKNGQPHIVPLSTAAQAVLDDLPTFEGGDYVFTAGDGSKPYANVIKPKKRLDTRTGVTGWTLHDVRRTVASGLGELGVAGETIARVLNHAEGQIAGVTARYNRADQTENKRRALEAWGQHVTGLTTSNVVEFKAG